MTSENIKSAFLVPFFGDLPSYFKFWAKSCEANHECFHWFVYNDRVSSRHVLNKAVTLIPYQFSEMVSDFQNMLGIKIPGSYVRKVCDYRIMFYFLRQHKEPLDEFDFIGYTDIDMIYGRLTRFLPPDMSRYSMISGDDEGPSGPFTLINRTCLNFLRNNDKIRTFLESPRHQSFNESPELMNIVSADKPVFCNTDPLQPARTAGFNFRKSFSVWDNAMVTVWDNRGNKKEGGFYHFSRYKDKKRFNVREYAINNDQWGIYKYGIIDIKSKKTLHRLKLSIFF